MSIVTLSLVEIRTRLEPRINLIAARQRAAPGSVGSMLEPIRPEDEAIWALGPVLMDTEDARDLLGSKRQLYGMGSALWYIAHASEAFRGKGRASELSNALRGTEAGDQLVGRPCEVYIRGVGWIAEPIVALRRDDKGWVTMITQSGHEMSSAFYEMR